jgi:heme/copper-type cytochrome/quinol oxidase subunit 2
MSALATAILIAAEKTPAEEGRDVVLVMLATGAVFLGVILLGQLFRWMGHRRRERRAAHRVY